MRYFQLMILLLCGNIALGCRCAITELNVAAEKSDYIALVRIKAILPTEVDSIRYLDSYHFRIIVEEITHFKGRRHQTEIIVDGGHPKFNTWTSCDFDINENEEWIVFGRTDRGHSVMYACSRSIRLADAVGFRDRQYKRGIEELNFLESYFHRSGQLPVKKEGALTQRNINERGLLSP